MNLESLFPKELVANWPTILTIIGIIAVSSGRTADYFRNKAKNRLAPGENKKRQSKKFSGGSGVHGDGNPSNSRNF